MRKIILAMLVILSASVLAFAESCSSAGATERKHTPQGDCDYKTETRTCCDDKQWSDWGKTCKPKYKECEEGDEGTGIYKLYSTSDPEGDKLVGHKNCKRVCKNGKWEYKFVGISCTNGFIEGNGGVDGKVCFIGKVGQTGRIKGHPNPNPKSVLGGGACLVQSKQEGDGCIKSEHGCWRKLWDDDKNGETVYLRCEYHGFFGGVLSNKPYSVKRVTVDYVRTLPEGCDQMVNLVYGESCSTIGECGYLAGYTDQSAIYKQCQISDTTEWNEGYSGDSECVSADY